MWVVGVLNGAGDRGGRGTRPGPPTFGWALARSLGRWGWLSRTPWRIAMDMEKALRIEPGPTEGLGVSEDEWWWTAPGRVHERLALSGRLVEDVDARTRVLAFRDLIVGTRLEEGRTLLSVVDATEGDPPAGDMAAIAARIGSDWMDAAEAAARQAELDGGRGDEAATREKETETEARIRDLALALGIDDGHTVTYRPSRREGHAPEVGISGSFLDESTALIEAAARLAVQLEGPRGQWAVDRPRIHPRIGGRWKMERPIKVWVRVPAEPSATLGAIIGSRRRATARTLRWLDGMAADVAPTWCGAGEGPAEVAGQIRAMARMEPPR